jgi:hypothetical protein
VTLCRWVFADVSLQESRVFSSTAMLTSHLPSYVSVGLGSFIYPSTTRIVKMKTQKPAVCRKIGMDFERAAQLHSE